MNERLPPSELVPTSSGAPSRKRGSARLVLPVERDGTSRRTFLKRAGYGVAAATLAGCSRAPVRHVVPRLSGTEGAPAGKPVWIATTCGGCAAGCGVLAKCVDGRPVKLEGLPGHPVSQGGLCAVGQAQVLSLYDSHRFGAPVVAGVKSDWATLDATVASKLESARGRVRLLTGTISGPSTRAWIAEFCSKFDAKHVEYDALSASAIAAAHSRTHEVRAVPGYRFDRARVVASFGADFLGTWISPVQFAADWRKARTFEAARPAVAKHWQIEARTSMTGLRADRREGLAPWETGDALAELCDALATRRGTPSRLATGSSRAWIAELAGELWEARGAALVVCDDADPAVQILVNQANEHLASYGATVDLTAPCRARLGDDAELRTLLSDMAAGTVGALVVVGCNPAYDLVAANFGAAAANVPFIVAVAPMADETTAAAHAVAPQLHALESWDDAEPTTGTLCLTQPAIAPLRGGRTARECLARWCGDARPDAELLRDHWKTAILVGPGFEPAFDRALETGWTNRWGVRTTKPRFVAAAVAAPLHRSEPEAGALAVVVYPKVAMLDGSQAHNAWLHELPDPVTKTTWDNYACLSPATAARLGVTTGDVVRVTSAGVGPVELPAHVQPGQHDGIVAIAQGYGRRGTDRFAFVGPQWLESKPTVDVGGAVGKSAAAFQVLDERGLVSSGRTATVAPIGGRHPLACTQDHHSLHVPEHLAPPDGKVRHAVRTVALADWRKDPAHAVPRHHEPADVDLWPADHETKGHRWGMVIDLAQCNGCSACVVACQAENNIPVVGKDEVLRHREMQWLRIDRYYEGEGGSVSASQQPMTCQHCANAPCETVCPVLATVHSSEGLNQQVYNRCVGTRYCANNCPYKVRRFNWFDYPRDDAFQNLGLNPIVTVRTRGVMEKCSLCVQRIQDGKAEAKRRGLPYADGDVTTACQQSCPVRAITFGDLNDAKSEVSGRAADGRAYQVLAELNVKPGVSYLADVRDRPAGGEAGDHGG
ncbi:MAG: 4Fe-4S dicluster domain-containing protein [Planctomycetes bacterium]|nr:4Fe-4S dicluster domain-containing protein [Planctomycetota bacterium]